MNYSNQIKLLELELSLIGQQIDEGTVTREQLSQHMLLSAQIRELKHLKNQQEHDRYEEHNENEF